MNIIRNLLILLFMILVASSMCDAGEIVDVDGLYIETERTIGTNRVYTLPDKSKPRYNLNLGLDISDPVFKILYLKNKISSTVDQSQFRYVALDAEVGLNAIFGQIYFRHYSGHILDAVDSDGDRFPQENVIGLRFNLLK